MKILVAGIGNIFMGDDGFGCEVVRRLSDQTWPGDVDIVDFGIRGMDLSYALLEGYDLAILIDAMQQGGKPGTVYVIEPEIDAVEISPVGSGEPLISPHGMDPERVLQLVASLGGRAPQVLLVACEPGFLGGDEGYMGLSEPVDLAVGEALQEIQRMVERVLQQDRGALSPAARKAATLQA